MRRLCAVLGGDVSRSLSPALHTAAAAACALEIAYVPVSCPSRADFDRALDALAVLGALGANVTIPYKLAALERSATLSEVAREIGAVNTLVFTRDGLHGENTDGPGFAAVVAALPRSALARVQVLGAGGAARAVVWALARAGAGEVHVCARRGSVPGGIATGPLAPVEGATLVVSTLPPEPALAIAAIDRFIDIAASPTIIELAYAPPGAPPPPLVAAARARGMTAHDGLPLLVEQAALSLASWTGGEVSRIREAMRALYTDSGQD